MTGRSMTATHVESAGSARVVAAAAVIAMTIGYSVLGRQTDGAPVAGRPVARSALARPLDLRRAPVAPAPTAMPADVVLPTFTPPGSHSALLSSPPGVRGEPASPPHEVSIPAIALDAPVAAVGAPGDRGELAVPASWTTVAWYQDGPMPGQVGSAVMAAHVDYDGHPGVFFHLRSLQQGTTVIVTALDGSMQRFVVLAVQEFAKLALPVDELFRTDGPKLLRLVTCGGAFDARDRVYADNVIVTAAAV